MTIIRVQKNKDYSTVCNKPFEDKRLHWETRGLLAYLFTKPNHWQVRLQDLVKQGPAKEYKIKKMLKEAQKFGYINRHRVQGAKGKFTWFSDIYEDPTQNPNPQSSGRFSTSGLPTSGKPHDIVSTDTVSTDSREGEIFSALENLSGGLNTEAPRLVDVWMEKHTTDRIMQAVAMAKQKGRKPIQYVDAILQDWEANGYPKTREQSVQARKTKKQGGESALDKYANQIGA